MYIFQDDEENSQDISISRSIHITEAQDNQYLRSHDEKFLGQLVEDVNSSYNTDEPDELMALANDVTAAETANLLLPEHQANFVDFDEFNICLNNILNDDVDADPELSPSMMADTMSTADVDQMFKVNSVNRKSNKTPIMSLPSDSSNNNNNNIINNSSSPHSSSELSTDILNMVQFEHIEFNFESELGHAATTSSSPSSNKMHFENGGYNFMTEESLGLNLVDAATCNSTATVSASVTTTANNTDDDTQTALNVIKRNSHSIVNIFQ